MDNSYEALLDFSVEFVFVAHESRPEDSPCRNRTCQTPPSLPISSSEYSPSSVMGLCSQNDTHE